MDPTMIDPSRDELLRQNEELARRLEEAEDTLRALGSGEVDAILVASRDQQVFTLEASDKAYQLLVETMPSAAATLKEDGTILACNRRFADLLHRSRQSIVGQNIEAFVAEESRENVRAMVREGCAAEVQGEVTLDRAADGPASAYLSMSSIREGALGTCLMLTDLTEQRHYHQLKRTQQALHAAEERLDLAQRAGCVGTFEWNLRSGRESWSPTSEELFGLPAGGHSGLHEDWLRLVHPDDRERAESDRQSAIAQHSALDSVFRIIRPDGELRWIASRGKVFYTPDGEPERMLGVILDLTDRKMIEQELRIADRRKDEFLATLAHELRNPLAPIRNAVQILKLKNSSDPAVNWAHGVLDRQAQLMSRLLEDLLDVSRITRHRLELRRDRVELAGLVAAALETSGPIIEAGGHSVSVELPPHPLVMEADAVRLAQVFANLLTNAAKYTEHGGTIQLKAARHGDEVVVSVRDSGIGIAGDNLPHVFEMFSQAQPAMMLSQGGLGIGLSLSKGLVELHGGSIEAHSDGPGRGSEFIVRLPVPSDSAVPAAAPAGSDEAVAAKPRRILVVDDNRDAADSLAMLLRSLGNEVTTAYDGERAAEQAEQTRPEIVLLDIGMPHLNGFDACRRMRNQAWGAGMHIIAMTGWGQEEDRRRTGEAGFDLHIVKPVDPTELMKLLASLPTDRANQTSSH